MNKKYYGNKKPEREDVVIFRYPPDPGKDFIKRVIGLAGERIEIRKRRVFINDQPLKEPYTQLEHEIEHSTNRVPGDNFGPVTVPNGKLFVLGDNRDHSYDSRYWGFVDIEALKGKALYVYWAKDKDRIGNKIN